MVFEKYKIIRNIAFLAIFIVSNSASAQNLVVNSSFEEYEHCITKEDVKSTPGSLPAVNIAKLKGWSCPSAMETADYFNDCATDTTYRTSTNYQGSQEPRTGQGYAGFYFKTEFLPEYREYIQGTLSQPLVRNKFYHVVFYVSLGDLSELAGSIIGVSFSKEPIVKENTFNKALTLTPQIANDSVRFITDKKRWIRVSGKFYADGGEQYFTIGNFRNDRKSSLIWLNDVRRFTQTYSCYYYIDDVCVSLDPNDCAEIPEDGKQGKPLETTYYQSGSMFIKGSVTDMYTKKPLMAKLILEEKGVEENAARFGSVENGKFFVTRMRANYLIHASKRGYIPKSAYISFNNYIESTDFKLVPYEKGAKSEMLSYATVENGKNVFVQYSEEELRHIAEFLGENPDLHIRINAYGLMENTDRETEENVRFVTEIRAKEIMDKLIDFGAMPYQVSCKGFGNAESAGAYRNEIEIMSFNPVKKDDIPKFDATGTIFDNQTKQPLNPVFYLTNLKTGVKKLLNSEDGSFTLKLLPGEYEISVNIPGYLPYNRKFEMPYDNLSVEVPMVKMGEDGKFTIRNILFNANSIQIDPVSYPVLDMVTEYLQKYKDIRMSIEGHTDGSNERTTDEYLVELSTKRSSAVRDYFISKGIAPERLEAIGFGRSKPIADNKTVEGRGQNRRIEFRIMN